MGTAAIHRQVCATAPTYQSTTSAEESSVPRRLASSQTASNSSWGTRTFPGAMRPAVVVVGSTDPGWHRTRGPTSTCCAVGADVPSTEVAGPWSSSTADARLGAAGGARRQVGRNRVDTLAALGAAVLVGALVAVVVLVVVGYVVWARTEPAPDLGTTTEVAAVGTFLLGALAWTRPAWAVPLAVGLLVVLAAERPLHHFATRLVTDQDVTDALRLFVVALVVYPLLPDRPMGPGGVLNPSRIWLLVVTLTVIGWVGYVAVRALGERVGLLVVGFLGGGHRRRTRAGLQTPR